LIVGDEIRRLKNSSSDPLFKAVFDGMQKGSLLNDGIVWAILARKIKETDMKNGFILDGFPRKLDQAFIMELSDFRYDLIVNLKQHEEVIIAKLLGRRVCISCGANYNVADIKFEGYNLPARKPKKNRICDCCGGKLESRKDDTKSTIKKRLKEYRDYTVPMEEYFQNGGKMVEFTTYAGVADYPKLLEIVKNRLGIV
jgi:adenylate kinase